MIEEDDSSIVDGKRLCASTKKICSKRPMEGYRYCIKHILEDPRAPFKQCEFISTKSLKQCTNPVSIYETDPRFCVSHRHIIESTQKRNTELSSGLSPPELDTPKKKILKVLSRQGLSKGKFYDEYKGQLATLREQHKEKQQRLQEIEIQKQQQAAEEEEESNSSSNNNNNNNNNTRHHGISNESNYFSQDPSEDKHLFKPINDNNMELYNSFDSDFYFSQSTLLTEEELIQRRKVYISKLTLLYKKQYSRFRERLRILRRHYITSIMESNNEIIDKDKEKEIDQEIDKEIDKEIDREIEKEIENKLTSTSKPKTTTSKTTTTTTTTTNKNEIKPKLCFKTNCTANPVLLSKYCFNHILEDGNQRLFIGCTYQTSVDRRCNYPILKLQIPTLCKEHLEIFNNNNEALKELPKKQKQFIKQLLGSNKHSFPTPYTPNPS
ncbi:hypothetical protein CYY_009225 [Polysphondylium violaceum]|uniref:KANL2-like probable zinc-finger domain-containing protein n=1 Tax=Polysphondylium violaceum TaxID=133409 RepID=A0A8J4PU02_9MYCE|nr:hypothetical protein CYY_009225 [Polysphondylium violaceum]